MVGMVALRHGWSLVRIQSAVAYLLMPCYLEKNQTGELKTVKVMKIIDDSIMSVMVSWLPLRLSVNGIRTGIAGSLADCADHETTNATGPPMNKLAFLLNWCSLK